MFDNVVSALIYSEGIERKCPMPKNFDDIYYIFQQMFRQIHIVLYQAAYLSDGLCNDVTPQIGLTMLRDSRRRP